KMAADGRFTNPQPVRTEKSTPAWLIMAAILAVGMGSCRRWQYFCLVIRGVEDKAAVVELLPQTHRNVRYQYHAGGRIFQGKGQPWPPAGPNCATTIEANKDLDKLTPQPRVHPNVLKARCRLKDQRIRPKGPSGHALDQGHHILQRGTSLF